MFKRPGKKRFKMSRRQSKKAYRKGAKVHKKNSARVMRGGYRL